jgi:hypothetical protein
MLVFISAYEPKYHVQITETEINLPLVNVNVPRIIFTAYRHLAGIVQYCMSDRIRRRTYEIIGAMPLAGMG